MRVRYSDVKGPRYDNVPDAITMSPEVFHVVVVGGGGGGDDGGGLNNTTKIGAARRGHKRRLRPTTPLLLANT